MSDERDTACPRPDRLREDGAATDRSPERSGAAPRPLCWCGQSARPPFCDGRHAEVGPLLGAQAADAREDERGSDEDPGPRLRRRRK